MSVGSSSRLQRASITSLDFSPIPLLSFTSFLALAQSTVAQFLLSSDNCKLVISEEEFQTTFDAVARDVLVAVAPRFCTYKRMLCVRDSRLFVGKRLVVKEQQLHTVLASLPFTPLLHPMVSFSQRAYFGIPDALVRHWHAHLSHFQTSTMTYDPTIPAFVPTPFSENIGSEAKPIVSAQDHSEISLFSAITQLVPKEHDLEVVLDLISPSGSFSSGLDSVVSLVDEPTKLQAGSRTASPTPITSPKLSQSSPSLHKNENAYPEARESSPCPVSPLNDSMAVPNVPPFSSADDLAEDDPSTHANLTVTAIRPDVVDIIQNTIGSSYRGQSPPVPSTRHVSQSLEAGQELKGHRDEVEQQTERTAQKSCGDAPSRNMVNPRNVVSTSGPFSVSQLTSFESPTPVNGLLERRELREREQAVQIAARMAADDGRQAVATSSVPRTRALQEGAEVLEREDGQDGPRRKRRCWDNAVSRALHFVTTPFDVEYWRRRQS